MSSNRKFLLTLAFLVLATFLVPYLFELSIFFTFFIIPAFAIFGLVFIVGFFQSRKLIFLGLTGLISVFISMKIWNHNEKVNYDEKKENAIQLINKLEKFERTNSQYPKNLGEIDSSISLEVYHYRTDSSGKTFTLSFNIGLFVDEQYNSAKQTWEIYD